MMKRILPLLTLALLFIGACGQEKPSNTKGEPAKKDSAAAVTSKSPADQKIADGVKIYETSCASCHDSGTAGAPKLGDKTVWTERIAQGMDVMTKRSIEGFDGKVGMMPPKGGNTALTDQEVTNAVTYMVDKVK
jgi:cytochrome c5